MAETSNPVSLRKAIGEVNELATRGQRIAFDLMTINNVTTEYNSTLNSIVSKLFALVGVSNILRDLMTVGSRDKDPVLALLSPQGLLRVQDLCQTWNMALIDVGPIVTDSDSIIHSKIAQLVSPSPMICNFPEIGMANALVRISDCLKGFSLLVSSTRCEEIGRQSTNASGDTAIALRNESCRLAETTWRLQRQNDTTSMLGTSTPLFHQPQSGSLFSSSYGPFGEGLFANPRRNPPVSVNPSQGSTAVDVKELQHPRGFRGRYGEPDYPFIDKKPFVQLNPPESGLNLEKSFEESELERYELLRKGKYPDPAMFGVWPPAFDKHTVQGHQIQKMLSKTDNIAPATEITEKSLEQAANEGPAIPRIHRETSIDAQFEFEVLSHSDAGVNTPGSTRDNTPTPESNTGRYEQEEASRKDQKTPTPSTNSTQNSNKPRRAAENIAATIEIVEPKDVLEAYMLTPRAEQIGNIVEWSTKITKLPLQLEQIETHLSGLGSDYSIIDAIGTLNPEEWRAIRAYTNPRGGIVVSVRNSHKVTMPTMFGNFDIASVIFVIKVSKDHNKSSFGDNVPVAFDRTEGFGGFQRQRSGTSGLIGNSQRNTQTGSLFGRSTGGEERGVTRCPEWESTPGQSLFGARPSGGLFGDAQSASTGQFAPQPGISGFRPAGQFQHPATSTAGSLNNPPKPSLFSNFSQIQPSLFNNTEPPLADNAQPSLFSNFCNTQPSLFRNSQQSGGLFGQSRPQHTSLFGSTPQQSIQSQTPSLFGSATQSNQPQISSLFGGTQSGGAPSLFGGATQHPAQPQISGLFGGTTQQSTQSQTSNLFGGTTQQSTQPGSLFRTNPVPQTASGGLFSNLADRTAAQASNGLCRAKQDDTARTSATPGSLFADYIADLAKKDATGTKETSESLSSDVLQQPVTTIIATSGKLCSSSTADTTKDEGSEKSANVATVGLDRGKVVSTDSQVTPLEGSSGTLTPQRTGALGFTNSPLKPAAKPTLFGSPSTPGSESPQPFGTPPTSGPFAQYAGTKSPFAAAASAPGITASALTGKPNKPFQKQSPSWLFGRSSSASAGTGTATESSESQKQPASSETQLKLPEELEKAIDIEVAKAIQAYKVAKKDRKDE